MTPSPALIWFIIGVVFLIAELAVPGFILIFFTAGSWIAAIAAGFMHIKLTSQIIVFVVSSLILLIGLRKYGLRTFKGKASSNIDDDYSSSKIGKTAVVTKAVAPNVPGEIKVKGSFWRAVADMKIEEGQSVVIESQESEDGLTFKVKPL